MPLMILGLIVLFGLLIIAVFNYLRGEPGDQSSPMRRRRNRAQHTADDDSNSKEDDPERTVLYFPIDKVETEKRKRNL